MHPNSTVTELMKAGPLGSQKAGRCRWPGSLHRHHGDNGNRHRGHGGVHPRCQAMDQRPPRCAMPPEPEGWQLA